MKNSIEAELKTWVYSGRIVIWTVVFALTFIFSIYTSYKTFSSENSFLLKVEQQAIQQDAYDDFMLSLTEPSVISNYNAEVLIAGIKNADSNLHALSPEHVLSYCVEVGYFFFPLLMTLLGALSVKSDIRSNIFRYRIAREGRWSYYFGKQTVLLGMTIVCVLAGMAIDYLVSVLTYGNINKNPIFSLIDVNGENYPNMGNNLGQLLFFGFYILLFLEIGFCISIISKSVLIPVILSVISFYVIPTYQFTPMNVLANVISPMCDFQGSVSFSCIPVNSFGVVIFIAFLFLLPFAVATFVYRFRSVYKQTQVIQ